MLKSLKIIARPAFKNVLRNPYNHLLYKSVEREGAVVCEYSARNMIFEDWDILHVHWPESLIETRSAFSAVRSMAQQVALIEQCRNRGAKVVWTIHDLHPHDFVYPKLEWYFWTWFIKRVDAVIALSADSLELARKQVTYLGERPSFVIPAGHFREYYPNTVERSEARRRLGLPEAATVITHLGQIRPYKNVPQLIRSFRALPQTDIVLLICGRLSKRCNIETEIMDAVGRDPRVRLRLQHIPDDEVQIYCNASDLMVFPYRNILNSGAAMLALSFNRPVLVPHMGSIPELCSSIGPAWTMTYRGELTSEILQKAVEWARDTDRGAIAPLASFEWTNIARQTVDAFREVLRAGRQSLHLQEA